MRRYAKTTSNAKKKDTFRKSLRWKRWRYEMIDYYNNLDSLTLKPLHKGFNVHHLSMKAEEYEILTPERFRPLNHKSHETIHFLYYYYSKDPFILDRLKVILDEMVKLNEN